MTDSKDKFNLDNLEDVSKLKNMTRNKYFSPKSNTEYIFKLVSTEVKTIKKKFENKEYNKYEIQIFVKEREFQNKDGVIDIDKDTNTNYSFEVNNQIMNKILSCYEKDIYYKYKKKEEQTKERTIISHEIKPIHTKK